MCVRVCVCPRPPLPVGCMCSRGVSRLLQGYSSNACRRGNRKEVITHLFLLSCDRHPLVSFSLSHILSLSFNLSRPFSLSDEWIYSSLFIHKAIKREGYEDKEKQQSLEKQVCQHAVASSLSPNHHSGLYLGRWVALCVCVCACICEETLQRCVELRLTPY